MERQPETGSFRARPAVSRTNDAPTRLPSVAARPTGSLPTQRARGSHPEEQTLIVPTRPSMPVSTLPVRSGRGASGLRWSRPLMFVGVVLTITAVLIVSVTQALQAGGHPGASAGTAASNTPAPTGRGPWTSSAGAVIVSAPRPLQAAPGALNTLEPCHDSTMFLPTITQWSVPPGCYALIYQPNPANYVQRPGFGYCNWWVRVTHPKHPDITENTSYPRGGTPAVGAAVFFVGNEQGATSAGHWAEVVGIAPDHYWVLISEMNFEWRGAGFGKIDYRYIHVSPGVQFVYIFS